MKHIFITIILVFGMTFSVMSQQEVYRPTEISKAVYFDVSPPLRDMPVIPAGKRDRSWKDGVVKNKLDMPEMRNQPLPEATPEDYLNAQTKQGERESELLLSVNGVGNLSFVLPPDTQGDVGPNHYMQMVNSSFAIWNKTGSIVYGPVDNRTFGMVSLVHGQDQTTEIRLFCTMNRLIAGSPASLLCQIIRTVLFMK